MKPPERTEGAFLLFKTCYYPFVDTPHFYIPQAVFDSLPANQQSLFLQGEFCGKIRPFLTLPTTHLVAGSAGFTPNIYDPYVGGFDWVKWEERPRKDEKELNRYQYKVGALTDQGYPVYALDKRTDPHHWMSLEEVAKHYPIE